MNRRLYIILYLLVYVGSGAYAQDIQEVKEINNGPNGSAYPHNFVIANNKLFFIATDEINYTRLWVTEGTTATTQMLGPMGGVIGSISGLVSYKGKVYFCYNDNINGLELWVSDGTIAGTKLFKDLYPGANSSFPRAFTIANNKLFFMAEELGGIKDLYVSDGTVAGTVVVKKGVDIFNGLTSFAILNNEVYFIGDNGSGAGYGLWKSNGTPGSAVLLRNDMIPGVSGCNYVVLNNKLYFSGFDYTHGSELWVSDGSSAGTHMVVNLGVDNGGILGSGAPAVMIVYNSKIYFPDIDDSHGVELWVTDGSATGTHLVKDIYPGTTGSQPFQITVYNGFLYMICSLTSELWKSNGSEVGTQLVKVISPYSKFSAVWNGKMYITNETFDNTVWESDGTAIGTGPLKVQNTDNPVYSSGPDQTFTEYNGELYFSGSCYTFTKAYELCKLTSVAAVKAFSFTGSGNWSNPANWSGNKVPPSTLPSGYNIVINGNCILDVTQHVQTGASITVAAGSTLLILGSLTIQ